MTGVTSGAARHLPGREMGPMGALPKQVRRRRVALGARFGDVPRVDRRKGVADGPDVMDAMAIDALRASRNARSQSLGVNTALI